MHDPDLIRDKLIQVRDALDRILRRFSGISRPEDFTSNDENKDRLDAIAMMLIAIGETFKKIDKETEGQLLSRYPEIDWKGVKGVRDVLAHNYFNLDEEEIYKICSENIGPLNKAVLVMIRGTER